MKEALLQKLGLTAILGFGLVFVGCVFLWAQEPDHTLLLGRLHTTQAIKVIDVLEQQDIEYYVNRGFLLVSPRDFKTIKVALHRAGINIDDAAFSNRFKGNNNEDSKPLHIGQQPWFMKLMRLLMATMVFIVLILVVMRPMVKDLIALNDTDKDNNEAVHHD
ncbi:MAG: hypothetical protein HRT35_09965 [Algicola sp.]|nr:hypothetical protein [Algicola sp.]